MSKRAILAMARAALRHADQPSAPVHTLTGPSDERAAQPVQEAA
jgi:hypothetical protein